MGVPAVTQNSSYLVPDEDIARACDALYRLGLPLVTECEWFRATSDDFWIRSCFHSLTRCLLPGDVRYLVPYPLSFASHALSELERLPRQVFQDSFLREPVYVPQPPAVYAPLLRTMLAYPRRSCLVDSQLNQTSQSLCVITCVMSNTATWTSTTTHSAKILRSIGAVEVVGKGWSCACEWRAGEEWMSDALVAVGSSPSRTFNGHWKVFGERSGPGKRALSIIKSYARLRHQGL
ncbi:hypothetical protein A0H81_02250 [Grifola frondosa]|uniref:Uncharacterized protein n=1 Tax=Grifola frondosa TaxID=5627 RepID=A0A1C7MMM4_GRIFR|nr:hypothetical protein A0H81_02250 [Grifola frondosa]